MSKYQAPLEFEPVPFQEAIDAAGNRNVVLPDVYYGQMQGIERAEAFSVANIAELDQLQQTLDSLTVALAEGKTYDQWRQGILQAPDVLELPLHRLDNIFRTNVQGAYARGRCQHIHRNKDRRPFLMYSAINDDRTRPHHLAMHGHVAPVDDPVWETWTPPAGYRCRCTVINLSPEQAEARQAADQKRLAKDADAAKARIEAAISGPDQGWDYTPCQGVEEHAHAIASEKAKHYHEVLQAKMQAAVDEADRLRKLDDFGEWDFLEYKKGSNEGGIYVDPDGQKWYVKIYDDPMQARSERAAHKLIELITGSAPETKLLHHEGRAIYASKWIDGLRKIDPALYAKLKIKLADQYAANALIKNWDVVGAARDNLLIGPDGRLIMIDAGGAMRYRAQGRAKAFTAGPVDELTTFLKPERSVSQVFGDIPQRNLDAAVRRLNDLTKKSILESFTTAGYGAAEAREMTEIVWARRKWMLEAVENKAKKVASGTYTAQQARKALQEAMDAHGGMRLSQADQEAWRRKFGWSQDDTPFLTPIRDYTGGGYETMNPELWKGARASKKMQALAAVARQGMEKLPRYAGSVNRGARTEIAKAASWIEANRKALRTGKPIEYNGFISTDTKGGWEKKVRMKIEAKGLQGVDVRRISQFGEEQEVLFPHQSRFFVTAIEEGKDRYGDDIITIFLVEDPRAMKATDVIRLAAGGP